MAVYSHLHIMKLYAYLTKLSEANDLIKIICPFIISLDTSRLNGEINVSRSIIFAKLEDPRRTSGRFFEIFAESIRARVSVFVQQNAMMLNL